MKHVSKRSPRAMQPRLRQLGIALALSAATFGAQAAGLGRLNLLSNLGQPLRAEIELTAVSGAEAGALTARLAGADAFSQAGLEYGSSLSSLRFSIQRRANGTPYVLVTSNQQVNDPFLDMLVELSWGSGRLVREYTVLLDPPETRAARTADAAPTVVPAVSPTAAAPTAPTPVRRAPRVDAPAPEAASPAPAPAPRRAPAATSVQAPTVSAGATSAGDYVVQGGDTASSIARANKPDGVSLEQMLAALYRDNPRAFGGNINKLMAGASVRIPDAGSAQSISGNDARRIIGQSANFGATSQRIARSAPEATVAQGGQQAAGRLSTQVQDQAAPAESTDRLKLTRPDAKGAAAPSAATKSSAPAAASPEELAAKDRELTETRGRLALLEKNVADLQQLLALKNQTLADLQQRGAPAKPADTTPPPAVTTLPAPAPVTSTATPVAPAPAANVAGPTTAPASPPTAVPPPVSTAPAPVPAAAPTPAPAPVKATTVTQSSSSEEHWYDALLDNTLLLVGLVVLAVLLIGGMIFARRRKAAAFEDSIFAANSALHANSVFGTTGGQSVDTANTGFHSNFVPVAGNLPEHNEVDPVAEADVYVAYGRDAQAEEILKEALRADPTRHAVRLKLLEIYAKRGDAKAFETVASELYAATGGQGDEWRQAAALGASIDPRNPLYAPPGAVVEVEPPAPVVAPAPLSRSEFTPAPLDFTMSAFGNKVKTEEVAKPVSTEHLRTEPMAPVEEPAPAMDLDFDLSQAQAHVQPLYAPAPAVAPAPPVEPPSPAAAPAEFNVSESTKPMVDPFTASAFGGDGTQRTAVNLPAFRARADEPADNAHTASQGFTASDIFGTSIVAETRPMYGEEPPHTTTATSSDFVRTDTHQYDKTELDPFAKMNLDLDPSAAHTASDFGNKSEVWQAMATKLDLALAYSDIGDKDGARELLEEVVRSGDQAQADRAKQLMTGLS